MRKRSIPQLRITLIPYFWMSRVRRGICLDYISQLHHFWLYNITIFLIYAYVITCIRIDRIYVIHKHMYIFNIT